MTDNEGMLVEIGVIKNDIHAIKRAQETQSEKLDAIIYAQRQNDVLDERIKVANHRVADLETSVKEMRKEMALFKMRLIAVSLILAAAIGGLDLVKRLL
jgi:predicted  nucleic acid-binding Zn-ribbon protein